MFGTRYFVTQTVTDGALHFGQAQEQKRTRDSFTALAGDPEYDVEAFLDQRGMDGVEERARAELRREWLDKIESWLGDIGGEAGLDFTRWRLINEVDRLRRQLGIARPRDLNKVREQTRERVAAFRKRQREAKEQEEDDRRERLLGLTVMLKQFVREQRNDFSAEALAAAMGWSTRYPVEVVTEMLAELKASGEFDRIIGEPVGD